MLEVSWRHRCLRALGLSIVAIGLLASFPALAQLKTEYCVEGTHTNATGCFPTLRQAERFMDVNAPSYRGVMKLFRTEQYGETRSRMIYAVEPQPPASWRAPVYRIAGWSDYLGAWCRRRGTSHSLEIMVAAATDGLATFYRLRELRKAPRRTPPLATPATKERSKALRIRDETYRGLRSVVLSVLQDRYLEAVVNFARALGSSDEMRLSHAEVRGGRMRRRGHAELQRRSSRNEESRRSVTAGAEGVWRKRAA